MNVLRVDLQGLVTRLTEGYGSHHNQDHAEMVAANAARIYAALKSDNPLLHDTGEVSCSSSYINIMCFTVIL